MQVGKTQFAQCCHPTLGDPIVGCCTEKSTVVHHQHCASLKNACRQSLSKWDNV